MYWSLGWEDASAPLRPAGHKALRRCCRRCRHRRRSCRRRCCHRHRRCCRRRSRNRPILALPRAPGHHIDPAVPLRSQTVAALRTCLSLHGSHELAPKPPSGCASLRTAAPAAGRAPALLQYGLADKVRGPQPARSGSSYRPIGARASATDDRSIPQPTLPTAVGTSATRLLLASVADALKRPAHCCTAAIHSACWPRD